MSPAHNTCLPGDEVGPLKMIYGGEVISLASPVGALAVMHGALQSAIGSMDEALEVEAAYLNAVKGLSTKA